MVIVSIFGWVVAGIIAGFIASKFVNLRGDDVRFGIGCAIVGAVVAGVLHALITGNGLNPWQPWGAGFALIGGAVGAAVWHLVRSRSISHESSTIRRSY
jgi:uncharacterized membrane protein YeaQ/YmgE (transglycosylase-associated protein family)